MDHLKKCLIKLLIGVFILGTVDSMGIGKPHQVVKITGANISCIDNPTLGKLEVKVESDGKMTMKVPVKTVIDEKMMIKLDATGPGMGDVSIETTVCKGMEMEETESVMKTMSPRKDKCNVPKGVYTFNKWMLDEVPPGLPDGKYSGIVTIYFLDKEPMCIMHASGTLTTQM